METFQFKPKAPATPMPTQPEPNTAKQEPSKPGGIPGQISEEEALRGGSTAKMDTISMPGLSGSGSSGNSVSVASLIDAKIVIEIVDALIPLLFIAIFHALKVYLKKSDIQLTAKEKETLAPIMQKCLESVNINFDNPWIALGVMLLVFYGSKATEKGLPQLQEIMKAKKQKKSDKLKEDRPMDKGPDPIPEKPIRKASEPEEAILVDDPNPPVKDPIAHSQVMLNNWTEEDVKRVMNKHRFSRAKSVEWLHKFWHKKGQIVQTWPVSGNAKMA